MKERINIFVFVDALGYEVVKQYPWFLKELKFRKAIQMQFGYSSTALPTILTGESPRTHEHFSFFYYDPKSSPFKKAFYLKLFSLLPEKISGWWKFRTLLSKFVKKHLGYTGYFQLYNMNLKSLDKMNYCEKKDIFSKGAFGNVKNIKDVLEEDGRKYYITPWQNSEDDNYKNVLREINDGEVEFLLMYTAQLDGVLHNNPIRSEPVQKILNIYNDRILNVYKQAKLKYKDVDITVISDHGMTPYTKSVDLRKSIKGMDLNEHEDYFAVYDSTMLRLWYLNPRARRMIQKHLEVVCQKHGSLVSDTDKTKFGIDFKNNKFGDDIFLLKPGLQIVPSDMGKKPMYGMHGYHPDHIHSNASILSLRPIPDYISHVSDFFKLFKAGVL